MCDGRDNTEKLCGFISIVVPQKKFNVFVFFRGREVEQMWINRNSKKNQSLNLIRSHVSIMTTVTVIIISLITNIKIAIIIIEITKNDYHNNNNNNNSNNNNNNHDNTGLELSFQKWSAKI